MLGILLSTLCFKLFNPHDNPQRVGVIIVPFYLFIYLFIYCFLELHLQHIEVPRLGVKSKLQLQAYATAVATVDLSHIYDLLHSLWLNP